VGAGPLGPGERAAAPFSDLPRGPLPDALAEQSDRQSADAVQTLVRVLLRDLAAAGRLVEKRHRSCDRSSVGATSWCSLAVTACRSASANATSGPTYVVTVMPLSFGDGLGRGASRDCT
jgi:hypothetical protein